ncbi:hypothetical protein V6N13_042930 [Hibiscus sabdariffa]
MVETAKAWAFKEGVTMANENKWQHMIIEGDAISIVNRLTNPGMDLSIPATILMETRQQIQRNLGYKAHYVRRTANGVAHSLAKWALENRSCIRFELDHSDFIFLFDAIND